MSPIINPTDTVRTSNYPGKYILVPRRRKGVSPVVEPARRWRCRAKLCYGKRDGQKTERANNPLQARHTKNSDPILDHELSENSHPRPSQEDRHWELRRLEQS